VAREVLTLARERSMSVGELKAKHKARAAVPRRAVVAVVGSGSRADTNLCKAVGRLVAKLGCHLLTGAGRATMAEVSGVFVAEPRRSGLVVGVVPGGVDARGAYGVKEGYPNPWVELAIYTHLPDSGTEGKSATSRNHINVLSADTVVALPGGAGTRSEIELAIGYGVPVVAFGWEPEGVAVARTGGELEQFLKRHLR